MTVAGRSILAVLAAVALPYVVAGLAVAAPAGPPATSTTGPAAQTRPAPPTLPTAPAVPAPPPRAIVLPHVGVSLVLPGEFAPTWVCRPQQAMRAQWNDPAEGLKTVSLRMVPVGEKDAVDDLADRLAAPSQGEQADVLKKTPMAVAGIEGSARLVRYRRGQQVMLAASAFFCRQFQEPRLRVCYVLEVEGAAEREARLLPILGQVIKSVKLEPLQHPAAPLAGDLCTPCQDDQGGYRLCPPQGWRVLPGPSQTQPGGTGIQMSQVDYLLDGREGLSVSVIWSDMPVATDAEACARTALDAIAKSAAREEAALRVVAQGQAKMAGLTGWQFLAERKPKATAPGGPSLLIAQRTICQPPRQAATRSYSLILVCQGQTPEAAAQAMETLAGSFELLPPPTTQPASQPTTQPAATPAPK